MRDAAPAGAGHRPWLASLSVGSVLLAIYAITLARGVTYWDAGEFLSAIKTLGIPHPPGTPVYVFVAHAWSVVTRPLIEFTIAVNLLSAVATAAAFALFADLVRRWSGSVWTACIAATCAGLMSTVWLNATETEVYALALAASAAILWCAYRYYETRDLRWVYCTAYLCGLAWALHLTALLVAPAALVCFIAGRAPVRAYVLGALFALLGASATLFLLLRAPHDPFVNQGNPETWQAWLDVVQRRQYDVAPLWPRRAPLWLQFGNVVEYADWQVALGIHPTPPPALARTIWTVLFVGLGVIGSRAHWRAHRMSWWVLSAFMGTAIVGVVVYLNLRAGPSFGYGVLPEGALREARERDYFFTWGFVCWGLWAGWGAVSLAERIRRYSWLAVLAPCVPLLLNWSAIRTARVDEQQAAASRSRAALEALPPRAVMLAAGDNDTYLLWYWQSVHAVRRDVTVVTIPLLGAGWYRTELARRGGLMPQSLVTTWRGEVKTVEAVRQAADRAGRPVVTSAMTGAYW